MYTHWDKIYAELAEAKRNAGNTDRFGTVHEVQGDKFRAVIGVKPNGQPLLSPWVHTSDQRGGNRERHQYVKGQNVRLSGVNGSFRNASVSHWAESQSFPAPQHADQVQGHTTQNKDVHTSASQDGYHDVFIADSDNPPQHQDQTGELQQQGSGGGQQQQQQQQQQNQQVEAKAKSRVNKDGPAVTHRVGKNVHVIAHQDGAVINYGESMENTIWVNKENCYSSKPIQIKKCPIKPDNG